MTLSRRSLLACFASLIVSPASSRTPMLTDMMTGVLYPAPGRIFEFGDVSTVYLRYIDAVGFRSRLVRGMGSGNEGVSERHRPLKASHWHRARAMRLSHSPLNCALCEAAAWKDAHGLSVQQKQGSPPLRAVTEHRTQHQVAPVQV